MTFPTDTLITVSNRDTVVTSDQVDELTVDVHETGITLVDLNLNHQIETTSGGAVIDVGPVESTVLQSVDTLTTIVDVYGGPQGRPGPTVISADDYNVAYLGSDGLLYVPEKARMPLDVEIDESDSVTLGYVYVGEAQPGTNKSAPSWRIKRIHDTGSATSIDWANGVADSTNVWDDRKTLTYGP